MAGQLRNCKKCGKLFLFVGSPVCKKCTELEEEQFQLVKQYLREHARASVAETSEATGVPPYMVVEFLRRGRLLGEIPMAQGQEPLCVICKKPVASGKNICSKCEQEMTSKDMTDKGFGKEQKNDTISKTRMYTMDTIRRRKD